MQQLAHLAPELLASRDIEGADWTPLLRAAVESMRGAWAADTSEKRRFIETVLDFGQGQGAFKRWRFEGTAGRQDYRVEMPTGRQVCIEAKGCPDGNNTTIWDRPPWAAEFIVWSLCPHSLVNQPGQGVWSGIANRLIPQKVVAEKKVVDAFIFWDGRCGTELRPCPKKFGVFGTLRSTATDIPGEFEEETWVPPPCIFMFPSSAPTPRNPDPPTHTVASCQFADALLGLFNVPAEQRSNYVHSVKAEARGASGGTELRVQITSRNWPDGRNRRVQGAWKPLRRD